MKTFAVTLFVLGLPYNESRTRVVEVEANTQDEAEKKAHDWYVADGWGVYDSEEIADKPSPRDVKDQFGNVLNVGDNICYVGNTNAGWRQTKTIVRSQVKEISYGALTDGVYWDWIITDNGSKISPSKVVKCY